MKNFLDIISAHTQPSSHQTIFRQGSTTYFYSAFLFPREVRDEINYLYSFVRTADDFVDSVPQQKKEFEQFCLLFDQSYRKKTSNFILADFIDLAKRKKFKKSWIDAFLYSMRLDTKKRKYKDFSELAVYLYGSAEVIGLMIAKMLDLSPKAYPYAKKLGKAMQFINFIRDINEDTSLGRIYIPQTELKKYDLKNLDYETCVHHPDQFKALIRAELKIYFRWQKEAEKGYQFIPINYLTAVKTAADLYKWTAVQIYEDPFIIFSRKVKPPLHTIITHAGQNLFKQYIWI